MDGDLDYIVFRERLLIAIADAQEPPGLAIMEIEPLCERIGLTGPISWFQVVAANLEEQGFGRDLSSHGIHYFLIGGAGLAEATKIRKAQRPKTLIEQLTGDTSQRLINLGNFAIALLALIIAALAISKSS